MQLDCGNHMHYENHSVSRWEGEKPVTDTGNFAREKNNEREHEMIIRSFTCLSSSVVSASSCRHWMCADETKTETMMANRQTRTDQTESSVLWMSMSI